MSRPNLPSLPLLALLFGAMGCQSTVAKDLEDFCRVVSEVERDGSLTPDEKLTRIDARRSEYARPAAIGAVDVWARLKEYSGEDKYKWLVTAARTEGRSDWRCSSYAKLLTAAEFARIAATRPEEAPTMASAATPAPKPAAPAAAAPATLAEKKPTAAPSKKAKHRRAKHRR